MSRKSRWFAVGALVYAIGLSFAPMTNGQATAVRQECGKLKTIWTNTKPQAVTVTARFTANCNESQESGEVTVYDGSGTKVLVLMVFKGAPSKPISFDVPANGHIDYLCHPAHNAPEDQCTSEILKVSATRVIAEHAK